MSNGRTRHRASFVSLFVVGLFGCSGSDSAPSSTSGTAGGGASAFGGAISGGQSAATKAGSGGALIGFGGVATTSGGGGSAAITAASGGNNLTGGAATIGGSPGSGGITAPVTTSKGGATAAGGSPSDGGSLASGGTTALATTAKGGTTSIGTTSNGGSTAKGGTTNTGGTTSTATTAKGGATGIGGTAAAGGTASTGTSPIKIWIAGDSTVATCSSACPCGWGGQFDALFNTNVTVVNSAVGGRSIQTWLYEANVTSTKGTNGECTLSSTAYNARWSAMTNATTGMKEGDYLLIQFGINDGDSACPRHVGTALYPTYLGTMAKAAKAVGAIPIFLTPVSAISCSGSTAVATRGFLTETKAAGTANGVTVIDLHQLSINLYNKLGLCPNNSDYTAGTVGAFFCNDHTHFETAGATQIAQVIAQALKDQKIALAAYLK